VGAEAAKAEWKRGRSEAQGEAHRPPLVVSFVLAYAAFAAGRLVFRVDAAWYDALRKPSWALPSVVQEAVWLAMFGVLAYTAVLVFRDAAGTKTAHAVLALRIVHYVALQGLVFLLFQRKALLPAAIDVTVLTLTGAAIAVTTSRKQRTAAWLLGVYTVWLLYDTTVVWALWALNR
jgi:tryptophan-rich sensory protein